MFRRALLGAGPALLFPCLLAAGCQPDLGECDESAARQIVFRETDGEPLYAGQALVQLHCSSAGSCHSPEAEGSNRGGAPAGLDFGLGLACTSTQDCDEQEEAVERLRANQRKTFDYRHDILRTVEDGSMPPGAAGESARAGFDYFLTATAAGLEDPLPSVEEKEGREILRNWLACGSPVVEQARTPADGGGEAGDDCGMGEVGRCVIAAAAQPPEPNWPSIYERLVEPVCLTCHEPSSPFYGPDSQELDFSSLAMEGDALTAMSGVDAAGSECAGTGQLIVPGDPMASLFYTKLLGTDAVTCGDPMPLDNTDGYPEAILQPIRQWIESLE